MYEDTLLEQTVEKYYDKVTWSRHYRIKPAAATGAISIAGLVKYQICDSSTCRPNQKYEFDVKLAARAAAVPASSRSQSETATPEPPPTAAAAEASTRFEQMVGKKGSQAVEGTWMVTVSPRQARPGDAVTLRSAHQNPARAAGAGHP